jgi:hypothetical protein
VAKPILGAFLRLFHPYPSNMDMNATLGQFLVYFLARFIAVKLTSFLRSEGAIEIGTLLSGVLFGLITAQTYVYFKNFPRDSRFIKALVCVLYTFCKRLLTMA